MSLRIRVLASIVALGIGPLLSMPVHAQSAKRVRIADVPAQPPSISDALENLADQPPTHTGFTFDRSMLQAARDMLQSEGMSPQRAAAALSSITYDHYGYAQPAVYTPQAMAAIVATYRTAGWQHLVNAHDLTSNTDARHKSLTDLWLHFSGTDIDGLTVMMRGVRNVNVIQVACQLRPIDLLHLGGHFGIPKVDPNAVMVPAPDNR